TALSPLSLQDPLPLYSVPSAYGGTAITIPNPSQTVYLSRYLASLYTDTGDLWHICDSLDATTGRAFSYSGGAGGWTHRLLQDTKSEEHTSELQSLRHL